MKKITLLVLACTLCASVGFAQNRKALRAKTMKTENTEAVSSHLFTPVYKFTKVQTNATPRMLANDASAVIVEEDFSKFTAGSETAPDATDLADVETGDISADYTQVPGWSGGAVFQAGGSAYIGFYGGDTGWLNTPILDFSANNGTFTITFRAKSALTSGDELNMLLLYPGEQYATSSQSVILTNEWQEYSISLSQGTAESYIQMWTYDGESFIDDIKISAEGISAPQNLTVSKYMGTSAELSWDAVEGADSYLLNVYYFSMETWDYAYLLKEEPVTGTSYTIEGLDPNEGYYFDVAAVQGDKISPLSESVSIVSPIDPPTPLPATNYSATSFTANWEAVEGASSYLLSVLYEGESDIEYVFENKEVQGTSYDVEDLTAGIVYYYQITAKMSDGSVSQPSEMVAALPTLSKPVVKEATDITATGFTANWEPVEFANVYLTTLYKEHTAKADETYTIANASFEGLESTGTLESPETFFDAYQLTRQDGAYGWYISMAATIPGAMGLDNSFAMFFGPSFMYSPQGNFGQAGGKATLTLDVVAPADDNLLVMFAEIIDNMITPIESSVKSIPVTPTMTEQKVTLEGGSDGDVILMYSENDQSVFFGSLKVDVDLKAGAKFSTTEDAVVAETNSCSFKDLTVVDGDVFAYDVMAAYVADSNNIVYSEISDKMEVQLSSSVASVAPAMAAVNVINGIANISNPAMEDVAVFGIDGKCIFTDNNGSESLSVELPAVGIYLVKVGTEIFKVIK
jgi:fibronectin type 3 domain-containing protein